MIGGAEIFALFLHRADRIELTEVHAAPEGDAVVPAFTAGGKRGARKRPAEGERPGFALRDAGARLSRRLTGG